MTDIRELRQLLDELDANKGGFAAAIADADAAVAVAKARLGRLRELGRLLKTTTERKPRKKRKKAAAAANVLPLDACCLLRDSDDPDVSGGFTGDE